MTAESGEVSTGGATPGKAAASLASMTGLANAIENMASAIVPLPLPASKFNRFVIHEGVGGEGLKRFYLFIFIFKSRGFGTL